MKTYLSQSSRKSSSGSARSKSAEPGSTNGPKSEQETAELDEQQERITTVERPWGSMIGNVMRTSTTKDSGSNSGEVLQPKRVRFPPVRPPILQAQRPSLIDGERVQRQPNDGNENKTGLPDRLKAGIETLSGLSMDDVRVHYNSSKPSQFQALAYTQGSEIYVQPGQEKHLSHEAWHVVQQKQGRVRTTAQVNGYPLNTDSHLESEADKAGKQALQIKPNPNRLLKTSPIRGSLQPMQRNGDPKSTWGSWLLTAGLSLAVLAYVAYTAKQKTEEHLRKDKAAKTLQEFKQIHLIDQASGGTGHQTSMYSTIKGLAALGYKGEVKLTYFRWKTDMWAKRFGKYPKNGKEAYKLYHGQEWKGSYKGIPITCIPIGKKDYAPGDAEYNQQKKNFEKALTKNSKDLATNEEEFWNTIWWPEAEGCRKEDLQGLGWSNRKWISKKNFENGEYEKYQEETVKNWFGKARTAHALDHYWNELYEQKKQNNENKKEKDKKGQNKTLHIFASLDEKEISEKMHDWLTLQSKEKDPWTIILQGFLWEKDKVRANPSVVKGKKTKVDIKDKLKNEELLPVYPVSVTNSNNIDEFVEERDKKQSPSVRKDIKDLLKKAKQKQIDLISVYYTEASAGSGRTYDKIVKMLNLGLQGINKRERPVVIALMGDDAEKYKKTGKKPLKQFELWEDRNKSVNDSEKIYVIALGRLGSFPLFERYSKLFVTEGLSTWQELLTVGTPTLSVLPSGNTQPWGVSDIGNKESQDQVKKASEALESVEKVGFNQNNKNLNKEKLNDLKTYLKEVLGYSQDTGLKAYYKEWQKKLGKSYKQGGNQLEKSLIELGKAMQ